MSIRQDYEVADIGGGYGMGMGGGGFVWIILLVLIFLFLKRDGYDGHGAYGYGKKDCLSNCDVDRDVLKQNCKDRETTMCEAEKTRALVLHEAEVTRGQDFMKTQLLLAEKNNEISNLKQTLFFEDKFCKLMGEVKKDYDKLACEVSHLPKTKPCYAETCTPITCSPCNIEDFGRRFEPRRCDC